MKRFGKRIISVMLILLLSVSCFVGSATPVNAATPAISISSKVSTSASEQKFEVYVSSEGSEVLQAVYQAQDGSSTISSGALNVNGSTPVTCYSSNTVTLLVMVQYKTEDGGTAWIQDIRTSMNSYYATISFVDENGAVIGSDSVMLSKYESPEVAYQAPATIDKGGVVYTTSMPTKLLKYGDSGAVVSYTSAAKEAKSYVINYVDENDKVLYTEAGSIAYGDAAKTLTAQATYQKDGNTYALKTSGSYEVTYDNAHSVYTFEYAKQIPAPETPYEITVNLVDENGALLYSIKQGLDVGGTASINLPSVYEVNFKKYQLQEGEPANIIREFASTDATTYTVKYKLADESAPYDITVNYVNYADGSILSAFTAQVTPDGVPYIYDISSMNTLTIGDMEYQVVAGQGNGAGQIVHTYGDAARSYNIYYTSEQIENPDAYPVTMRYICVNDNKVLQTAAQDVEFASSITFDEAPATLTVDGKDYIRLNGQEGEVVHSYHTPQNSYAVYYHDASIPMEEAPEVVTQIVTQYVTSEDGTISTNGDGTVVPESVPVTTIRDNNDDEADEEGEDIMYNADGEQITIEDGQIVTVEDEEVPLEGEMDLSQVADEMIPLDGEEQAEEADADEVVASNSSLATWGVVGGIVIIALVLFLLLSKKRKNA